MQEHWSQKGDKISIIIKLLAVVIILLGISRFFSSGANDQKYEPSSEDLIEITGYDINGVYSGKALYKDNGTEWTVDMTVSGNRITDIRWTYYKSPTTDSNVSWNSIGNVRFTEAKIHDHGAKKKAVYIHDSKFENGVLELDFRQDKYSGTAEYLKLTYDMAEEAKPGRYSRTNGVFVRSAKEGCVESEIVAEFPEIRNSRIIAKEDVDLMPSGVMIRDWIWNAVEKSPEYRMQMEFEKMGISKVVGGIAKHATLKAAGMPKWSPRGGLRLNINDVYLKSEGTKTEFRENSNTTYSIAIFSGYGFPIKVMMCRDGMYAINPERETRKYRDPKTRTTRHEYLRYEMERRE